MARKQITSVPLNNIKVIFIITGRNMAFSTAFRLHPRFILSVKEEMSKPKESITPWALGPILQQECLSNIAAYIMVCGPSQIKSETRPWVPWALLIDPLLLKQMEGSNKEVRVYIPLLCPSPEQEADHPLSFRPRLLYKDAFAIHFLHLNHTLNRKP